MPVRAGLAQPDLRGRGDLPVVQRVAALAGARRGDEVLAGGADVVGVAHEVRHVADAPGDVHRQQAFGEAVIIVGVAAIVELSDAGDVVAALAQSVGPASDAPVIGDRVVPRAVTVHREAGRKAGSRRDADRRRRVGGGEAAAPRGERVERRCANNRVPGVPGNLAVVLVRHDDEQVLRRGRHRRSSGQLPGDRIRGSRTPGRNC
jgi:hypothetical protein